MKLLILAQNPKKIMNKKDPLKGTKSWTVLSRWLIEANVPGSHVELRNALSAVGDRSLTITTVRNQVETRRWVPEIIEFPVIVCLGRIPEQAVRFTREAFFPNVTSWDHFFLPHPSGLNRKLNDPETHLEAVETLKEAYKRLLTLKTYEARIIG